MTIIRMQTMHGVTVPMEARRDIVKYLSDTRGLAPEESAPQRALIERRLNRVESFDHPTFQAMCARCHTGGRPLLQRRPQKEWERLVHFHVGQFPTLEYQSMARDRDWLDIALNDIAPWLGDSHGLESEAWQAWQDNGIDSPDGDWQLWGHWPGEGDFYADVTITAADGEDAYDLTLDGAFTDGRQLDGEGQAMVYTGYEWRANLNLNGHDFKQVLDLAGDRPNGRIFDDRDEAFGIQVEMLPADEVATPALVASQPAALQAGMRGRLVLLGHGLGKGGIDLGEGVTVHEVVERSDSRVVLDVETASDLTPGWLPVQVGEADADTLLAGYQTVDRLELSPDLGVARVASEATPAVSGVFSAQGYLDNPEGDDIPLGRVPVTWSVAPWDEIAEDEEDVKYAGTLDAATGIFSPGGAGPNPLRRFDTNNAGNLRVTASVVGQEDVQDDAHLIVTVQRWNNPPLR